MSELNKRAEFAHYDSMTTEELQEILRKHAHDELETEPDTDELYYIMEVLVRRKEEEDPHAFRSDEEALADFRENYMSRAMQAGRTKVARFPNRAFRVAAAVLAIVVILVVGTSVTAEAFNVDIWGKFATWTKEIFQFADNPQGTTVPNPEKDNSLELASLQAALDQHQVVEKIVPTWLPDGYVNKALKVKESPRVLNINANYEKDGSDLIIKICQTIGVPADQVEKNDDLLEVYVVDGVEYYIFSNTETLQAAWSIGEFECLIIGKITLEEMKMMIDSIK